MKKWLLTIALLLTSSIANSAILQVDGVGGQLIGARGVDVGGTLYDVQFLDGECVSLIIGCDGIGDFVFNNAAEANAASAALLDQVFIDVAGGLGGLYGSHPTLIRGCEFSFPECQVDTPYALNPDIILGDLQEVLVSIAFIRDSSVGEFFGDEISLNAIWSIRLPEEFGSDSTTGYDDAVAVLAVWSFHAVPEPSAIVLMDLGLVGLGFARRKKAA